MVTLPWMAQNRRIGRVDALLDRFLGSRPQLLKFVKYSTASASGVVAGQTTLLFCLLVLDLGPVPSNITGVMVGTIPNYLINRAWTFEKRGAHSFTREVLPYWSMAVLGLLLSTFTVAWAADRWDDSAIAISLANISAFAVLWVAKYFVLDKVLFAPIAAVVEAVEAD